MANSKVTDLTALTDVNMVDILYIINDPAGTPESRKSSVLELFKAVNTLANSTTVSGADIIQIIDDPSGTPVAEKRTVTQIVGSVGLLKAGGTMDDGANVAVGSSTGTKLGTSASQKMGFWNATPVVQPTALTVQLTGITHAEPGTPDYAIQGMTNSAPYGFVTQDEGNSLLKVVANLQTRLSELETKLQTIGVIA